MPTASDPPTMHHCEKLGSIFLKTSLQRGFSWVLSNAAAAPAALTLPYQPWQCQCQPSIPHLLRSSIVWHNLPSTLQMMSLLQTTGRGITSHSDIYNKGAFSAPELCCAT